MSTKIYDGFVIKKPFTKCAVKPLPLGMGI